MAEAKFYLMTDSPCDFSPEMVKETGIGIFHFTYTEAGKADGGFHGVDDLFVSRTPHEFYEAIRHGAQPMTSQPSQMEFEKAFKERAKADLPTVYLAFSSGISGCYEGACTALERVKDELGEPHLPIYIVDCKIGSTSQYLFIVEAIRQRDKGLTAQEMVAWAEEARYYVHTIFMVDNLDTLHRGGRIPKSVAVVGGALDVKPLLTFDLDGALSIIAVSRGRKKGIKRMANFYRKLHSTDMLSSAVAIGNADCPRDAERMANEVTKINDSAIPMISTIGPTIGCHVGPGMLSCCFWGPDRRKNVSVSDRIAHSVRSSK